jgi:hypothetical protein
MENGIVITVQLEVFLPKLYGGKYAEETLGNLQIGRLDAPRGQKKQIIFALCGCEDTKQFRSLQRRVDRAIKKTTSDPTDDRRRRITETEGDSSPPQKRRKGKSSSLHVPPPPPSAEGESVTSMYHRPYHRPSSA